MNIISNKFAVALILLLNSTLVLSLDNIWQDASLSARSSTQSGLSHYFDANDRALRNKLSLAPGEVRGVTDTIQLPMPDGSLAKFSIVESSIMEDGLAAEFPQIKSYKVYGIDDPIASGRVDISPRGFRGMLMTSQGRVFIDPAGNVANRYSSSFSTGGHGQSDQPFQCGVETLAEQASAVDINFSRTQTANRVPGSLVIYRLAVAATSEYVAAVGGTLTSTMSEINTAINRVNQIYERDLGIRFILITNNSSLIEIGADFGLSNDNGNALIEENQTRIQSTIGSANYDVGHVFSTGGGGVASPQACVDGGKARGVTGLPNPTGDGFYIDFVAHEIGHQFGGNHTWNGSTGGCTPGQLSPATAFEPGSGTTILSYAGICGAEDIASNSDATFHAGSIVEINTYIAGVGACGVSSAITPANSEPTSVNAGVDRIIPMGTPFLLTGSAVDADTLTYSWDQMDAGTVTTTAATIGTDRGNNPLFRSHIPQPTGIRYFPSLRSQLDGVTTIGETLPTMGRTLNFRLTARDGRSGQGIDDVAVTVDAASGPFRVTSHSGPTPPPIDASGATNVIVTWNKADTDLAPVNCANVDISLLTFSADGSTFAETELAGGTGTANDGTQSVLIPDMSSSKARFKVQCSDNIFFDVSDADLNITGLTPFPTTGFSANISTTVNNTPITTGGTTTPTGGTTPTTGGTTPTTSSGGGGLADLALVTFLLSLLMGGYWLRSQGMAVVNR